MIAYVSCMCKGAVSASVIFINGRCVAKKVTKIQGGIDPSCQYTNIINAYKVGFTLLKNVVERNKEIDSIVIESNNSAFKAWLDRGFSLPKYADEFFDMLNVLNDVPVKYTCVHNKEVKAKLYAKESCVEKERLSGVEDLLR